MNHNIEILMLFVKMHFETIEWRHLFLTRPIFTFMFWFVPQIPFK